MPTTHELTHLTDPKSPNAAYIRQSSLESLRATLLEFR